MTVEEFWQLIDATRISSQNNPIEQAQMLEDILFTMPVEDIIDYQNHLDYYMTKAFDADLWNAAYIIGEGCSEDGFIDFRAWLIAQGKELYELALQNPEVLIDYVVPEKRYLTRTDALPYVAHCAHEKLFGDCIAEDKLRHEVPDDITTLESCLRSKSSGFIECLKQNYPKLWAKFG